MYNISIAAKFDSQLKQIQSQQKFAGQMQQEKTGIDAVDSFIKTNTMTDSAAPENSLGDESRMEIVRHKILLGCQLNDDDLKFLKDKSPELYDEYMAAEDAREQEEKIYQRALRLCSTREDVNRVKNMSISRCVARADQIAKNRDLSLDQKAIRIGAERRKMNDIYRHSNEFMRSGKYVAMPSEKKAASRNNATSAFAALQVYAEIAIANAEERLDQLTKETYASFQKDENDRVRRNYLI